MLNLRKLISDETFFAIEHAVVNGHEVRTFKNQPDSLAEIFRSMGCYGDADFMVYEDKRVSFNETLALAQSLALALREDFGINQGDKVALVFANTPEWVIAFTAIVLAGGVAVPIGSDMNLETASFIVEHSESRLVIAESKKTAKYLLKNNSVPMICQSHILAKNSTILKDVLDKYKGSTSPAVEPQPDDLVAIMYTSGSTGRPRGVVCSNRNIISSVMSWTMFGTPYDRCESDMQKPLPHACLVAAPLSHATSCHSLFIFSIMIGRKIVLMKHWDAKQAVTLMANEGVSYFNGVPTMSAEISMLDNIGDYDLSRLTHISSAGSKRPEKQVAQIRAALPNTTVMSGYGTTETNAMGTIVFGDDYYQHPSSAGYAVPPLVDMEVKDSNFEACAPNQRGEICIKSPANSVGYWKDASSTASAFKDGWHLTGDVGYFDDEGRLFVTGRIKDIVICGGENVSCLEVEGCLYSFSNSDQAYVEEVAVFAVDDERLEEVVGAVIYVKEGSNISKEDISEYCRSKLEWFKVPQHIWLTHEQLPRLYNGKIDKKETRKLFLENQ